MSINVLKAIEELGKMEDKITDLEFISPVFNNEEVVTYLDGLAYKFKIKKTVSGWYKIRPVNNSKARIVGEANIEEKEKYLKRLGKLRLTLTLKRDKIFLAVPDKNNKYGLSSSELIPVLLFDDSVLDFDRVVARYDGANVWFESVDFNNDPTKADYLRESLEKHIEFKKLKVSNFTFEEKLSYTLRTAFDKNFLKCSKEDIIRGDVEHAGGEFVRFTERSDHYSVTYKVDGEEYTSHISKDESHKVIAAGICLNGNDNLFDLKSLVTVVREAQHRKVIHRFNIH